MDQLHLNYFYAFSSYFTLECNCYLLLRAISNNELVGGHAYLLSGQSVKDECVFQISIHTCNNNIARLKSKATELADNCVPQIHLSLNFHWIESICGLGNAYEECLGTRI